MDKGALQMYNENDFLNCGGFPYQDDSCRIVCIVKELFEEKDIPIRPVLQESIKELRKDSKEKNEKRYNYLDTEERLYLSESDDRVLPCCLSTCTTTLIGI